MESLHQFPLFRGLEKNPRDLEQLASLMKRELFNSRDPIIDEKKIDSRIFFLLSGKVEVNKMDENGQIVVLGRTDASSHPCFGESLLVGETQRSANVVAQSQCECLSLQAKDFAAFMRTHPAIVARIYQNLAKLLFERLAKADRDILIAGIALKR
jgi:CRP-like cAMP-binding protein